MHKFIRSCAKSIFYGVTKNRSTVKEQHRFVHSSSVTIRAEVNRVTAETTTKGDVESANYLQDEDFFRVKDSVRIRELFNARVHLGHKDGARNNFMAPYIFGNRLGVDIIDLDQTVPLMRDALNFIAHVAFRNGIILFISRHLQTLPIIEQLAIRTGEYAHCRHWVEGTFTNSVMHYGSMIRFPDLVVFLSTHDTVFQQHKAIVEAAKMNIPTVGIVDTSSDPRLITYPVPGNDDTPSAIQLYCDLFEKAVVAGKELRKEFEG